VAIKAQVLAGGRGLAGAIKFGKGSDTVRQAAAQVLETSVGGEKPRGLLVEEKLEPIRELYAGVTWDCQRKCAVVIASSRGGVDIETLAREYPQAVVRKYVDPFKGFGAYQARELAAAINLKGQELVQYASILISLWRIFEKHDAELVEINPLAVRSDGRLVALDAKIIIDDKSIFRQSELLGRLEPLPEVKAEGLASRRQRAMELGIPTYIEFEGGSIGVVADGAGSGMLTLDLILDRDGKTGIYCELGGEATPQLIENAMLVAVNAENLRVILVNLIGGLNRMDEMAVGITNYFAKNPSKLRVVVRMSGTMQEEGRKILNAAGIQFFDNLYEAVDTAVQLSRGG
jgi:succinyl-CoA synthetase beta subunit